MDLVGLSWLISKLRCYLLIYHYCSLESFSKIIASNSIRASDLTKMNDPLELQLGQDLVAKLYDDVFPNSDMSPNFKRDDYFYFGCSFSAKGDLLSQWRAYADNASGLSIGLDQKNFKKINHVTVRASDDKWVQNHKFSIEKVIYNKDIFKKKCIDILQEFERDHGVPSKKSPGRLMMLYQRLQKEICVFKNIFYKEEQEFRLCRVVYKKAIEEARCSNYAPHLELFGDLDYVVSNHGLRAFTALKLRAEGVSSVQRVVLGPRNNDSIDGIRDYLALHGFVGVDVVRSEGAYR